MESIKHLIKNSGDSVLINYAYSQQQLTILLNLGEINKDITLTINTDHLSFDGFYLEKNEPFYRTCRIEVKELIAILSIENGIYIPAQQFGKLMNETRENYNLAYGKKASDFKYIFSLVGYGKLISCLLPDLSCISLS